ncbi:MAG: hypothetical protein OEM59_08765 [Rhodospirillales bacterium]|nr:hypothetical protein [Rhodospirillales bacterium]
MRHAYNTRARIAEALNDYALLEDTLGKIIDYTPSQGSQDVNYEKDFLVGIPDKVISEDVLSKYNQLYQRIRGAR